MHIGASMIKQTCFSLCALNVGVIVPRILFQSSSCACSNTLDWTPVDALKGCKKNWHCQKSNETLSYLISFSQLWQQIVQLYWRSGFWRQVGEKFIHKFLSSFPQFLPVFTSVYITLSIIIRWCLKSARFVPYLHIDETWFFRCPARDRKVSSTKNFSGREVDLERNLCHKQHIYHQKSINIQQSFRLGCRATLYSKRLINKQEGGF